MINGEAFDWESTKIYLPTGLVASAKDIDYSGEQDAEEVYGQGSLPRGYGKKEYKASGKLTIDLTEFSILKDYAVGLGRGLLGIPPFPIVAQYANADQPTVTDTLPTCKITKWTKSTAVGQVDHPVEIEFKCFDPILHDGLPDLIEI